VRCVIYSCSFQRHDEELSRDNREFLSQVVLEQYGPPYQEEALSSPPWVVSPLKGVTCPRGEYKEGSQRTGLIAKKIGVHPMWEKNGERFLATLVQVINYKVNK
jgi:hypothetical protein